VVTNNGWKNNFDFNCNRRLNDFQPQNLSNILWSFATSAIENKLLFSEIGNECILRKFDGFKAQEISSHKLIHILQYTNINKLK
jgi:hypothetical protein